MCDEQRPVQKQYVQRESLVAGAQGLICMH